MDDVFDVMVGAPGDSPCNTLTLSAADIVVPVEMDLSVDPLQDDEVWLRSVDGSYERVLYADDPDVERHEEKRLFLYGFRGVPRGIYEVFIRVGGKEYAAFRGLIVQRDGVFLGGKKLSSAWSGKGFEPQDPLPPGPAPVLSVLNPEETSSTLMRPIDAPYPDEEDL